MMMLLHKAVVQNSRTSPLLLSSVVNSNFNGNVTPTITSSRTFVSKRQQQEEEGRTQRPIFVAATKQHVGKTSTSLALLSGLQKRFDKVGFIKPVGQQHVTVYSKLLGKE
jgi:BioD-like N-terminal domain of phosphotransacetylase